MPNTPTLAELLSRAFNTPFACNFVHDWAKWSDVKILDITKGESKVGFIYQQFRTCKTCGMVQGRDWKTSL